MREGNDTAGAVFILIHGGLHGGWCWERMQPLLGAPSVAVDLPGREGNPADLEEITAEDWARHVAAEIEAADGGNVILVAHSLGGLTALNAARLMPDRVAHLVFVSALVPAEGQRIADLLAPGAEPDVLFDANGEFPVPAAESVEHLLANDMSHDEAIALHGRLSPEPRLPFLERFTWSGVPDVPRTYIRCSRDNGVPWDLQEHMIMNLRSAQQVVLSSGHNVMMSHAEQLAEALNGIADQVKGTMT
jgi:pimeloyl-ACP methyl ester carboxylesterase